MTRAEDEEFQEEEIEYAPEREWWKRTYPIDILPKPIAGEFHAIRRKFGIDIANLVLFVYKIWGSDVSKALARRILSFDDHESLYSFLVSKIDLFDERSRKILSTMIHVYKYTHYVDELIKLASEYEKECPGVRDEALDLYHSLALRGHYYTPDCIVIYVMRVKGCVNIPSADPRCRNVFDHVSKIMNKGGRK